MKRRSESIQSHKVQLSSVKLHYVEAGPPEAPAIMLLHGWPQTWLEWSDVIPPLAKRYRVIAPDLRGLGDSSRTVGGYDTQTVAADIVELLDHLGLQRIRLVGHDIGALVAYALAAKWRDRVMELAILDVLLPGYGLEQLVKLDADGWGIWHFPFHSSPMSEFLIKGRERPYMTWFFRNMAYAPGAISKDHIDEYVRAYAAPGAMRSALAYYSAFYQDGLQNLETGKTKLTIPVLAVGGSASVGSMVADDMRMVAENVTEDIAPESGHWIPEEQSEWLVDRLLRFFKQEVKI